MYSRTLLLLLTRTVFRDMARLVTRVTKLFHHLSLTPELRLTLTTSVDLTVYSLTFRLRFAHDHTKLL